MKKKKHGFFRWLIKTFCPGWHLAKDPDRTKAKEESHVASQSIHTGDAESPTLRESEGDGCNHDQGNPSFGL